MTEYKYAGFWIRVVAAIIDSILLMLVVLPVVLAIYGKNYFVSDSFIQGFWDVLFTYIFPAIVVIIFWSYRSATPGKMITRVNIVDAATGEKPSTRQYLLRYIGYYFSSIPFFLGIIWVAIDKRKQGWHDKLAGTLVVYFE